MELVVLTGELEEVSYLVKAYEVSHQPQKGSAYLAVGVMDGGEEMVVVKAHLLKNTLNSMKKYWRKSGFAYLAFVVAYSLHKSSLHARVAHAVPSARQNALALCT